MPEPKISLPLMLKAMQWERAKGELRALVMMQGSYYPMYEARTGARLSNSKWIKLVQLVNGLIKQVEDEELMVPPCDDDFMKEEEVDIDSIWKEYRDMDE